MIGVGVGQTIRLGIVAGETGPCSAVLGFRSVRGAAIGADKRVDLAPHTADFLDLTPALIRGRLEVRPVVQVMAGPCFPSAAVFERFTGRTTAHARRHRSLPTGEGEVHFAPVGGAPGQKLRLGVVCALDTRMGGTCRGELVFHDARGVDIGEAAPFNLMPGEAAFREVSIDGRQRREIVPCLRPERLNPGGLAGAIGSLQVVEDLTGWTTVYVDPCF